VVLLKHAINSPNPAGYSMRSFFHTLSKHRFLLLFIAVLASLLIRPAVPLCVEDRNATRHAVKRAVVAVILKDASPTSYQNKTTGTAAGFAVDALDIIARRAGLSVSYVFAGNWEEAIEMLGRGAADLAPDMAVTYQRLMVMDFSAPLEVVPLNYFVRRESNWTEQDLASCSVGVMKGSVAGEMLNRRKGIRLAQYDSYSQGLFELLSGKIDVFAGPAPTIFKQAHDARVVERLKTVGKPLSEIKRCIAVRKGNAELLTLIDRSMAGFIGSPEYKAIYQKWYGSPDSYWTASRVSVAAALVIGLVIFAMASWRYYSISSLNRELALSAAERKKAEEEVRALNSHLENLVSERTTELEQSNRDLSGFSYAISHELRGPIARLQGFSAALMEECDNPESDESRYIARRINTASHQLQHVVDSLLLLNRLSRAELAREAVDLSATASEIAGRLVVENVGQQVEIEVMPGVVADCDGRLMTICLENLLGNAFKFCGATPGAKVEFGAYQDNDLTVYFVRDNGAGFDMGYAKKLFVPFSRLHQQEDFPGSGIGLALVHRIVERHGGRIWADAEPNKGACFSFTLGV